jgi:hypothetical protein
MIFNQSIDGLFDHIPHRYVQFIGFIVQNVLKIIGDGTNEIRLHFAVILKAAHVSH